jgi:hypothetical protein
VEIYIYRDVPVTESLLATILREAVSTETRAYQADWLAYDVSASRIAVGKSQVL